MIIIIIMIIPLIPLIVMIIIIIITQIIVVVRTIIMLPVWAPKLRFSPRNCTPLPTILY